jgi:RNA polymerase sigma-70 factor, ECF subfamily
MSKTSYIRAILPYKMGMLFRFGLKIASNNEEADELAQATAVKALENEWAYSKDKGHVNAWLWTLMKRMKIDKYRKSVLRNEVSMDVLLDRECGGPGPEASLRLKEILAEIDSLPDRFREVLIGKAINGKTFREVAEELGLSVTNCKYRHREAKVHLFGKLCAKGLVKPGDFKVSVRK